MTNNQIDDDVHICRYLDNGTPEKERSRRNGGPKP